MPKKSTGRKKGIQQSIPRHRIGLNKIDSSNEGKSNARGVWTHLGFSPSQILSFGRKCFQLVLASCEKLHLVGFTRTKEGEFVPLTPKHQIGHYAAIAVCLGIYLQKMWGAAEILLHQELRMESFICVTVLLAYTIALVLGSVVVLRPKETMDLLNSWSHLSDSMEMMEPNYEFHPLGNIPVCLKTMGGFFSSEAVPPLVAILSLMLQDFPNLWFPMMDRSGLIPQGILPSWLWRILFSGIEWVTVQPFMMMAVLGTNFMYVGNGALSTFVKNLGRINIGSIRSRRRVEQIYVQLELFSRITQVWFRLFFPAWLVSASAAVIILAFVAIRYTELPLYIYILFPYCAFNLLGLIFWQSYDMLCVIRGSEDILSQLRQRHTSYFQGMTGAERVEEMKRSKAFRPVMFPVAGAEFSINVPIGAWDEIVNQLLFLLSLYLMGKLFAHLTHSHLRRQ